MERGVMLLLALSDGGPCFETSVALKGETINISFNLVIGNYMDLPTYLGFLDIFRLFSPNAAWCRLILS